MRVTIPTQSRFEQLYYSLSEKYTEYTLSAMIAQRVDKTITAIYMYLRRYFMSGTEQYKRTLITAMEAILEENHVNN